MQNCSNQWRDRAEVDLVRAAQGGEADAFSELLRRSRRSMLSGAWMILKNSDEAEDAVQAACWKAFQHLETFRGEASFNTWLTTITVNQARMRRRQLRRLKLVLVDDPPNPADVRLRDAMPNAEELYAAQELVRMLNGEIRRLPAQLRHAMLLHIQNLSVAEVAERLGVTIAAAKARLFRARVRLHRRMRPYVELGAAEG